MFIRCECPEVTILYIFCIFCVIHHGTFSTNFTLFFLCRLDYLIWFLQHCGGMFSFKATLSGILRLPVTVQKLMKSYQIHINVHIFVGHRFTGYPWPGTPKNVTFQQRSLESLAPGAAFAGFASWNRGDRCPSPAGSCRWVVHNHSRRMVRPSIAKLTYNLVNSSSLGDIPRLQSMGLFMVYWVYHIVYLVLWFVRSLGTRVYGGIYLWLMR